jgi:proteasome lid subunit RPN8/RPN11/ParB-like chromosome segregation protein Spo0J
VKILSARQSDFVDKTTVTIKSIAYYKMLVHVLRFGNKARHRRQFREVMGMLIGRLEGEGEVKNVIIEDTVPISHGGSIEVAFKPEDYVSFSYVDADYAEKDPPLFTVGWYHSHPALKIFFSSTDIKNQLGWQTPNPSAIGIVFDHTYLETPGDLGFRTFRLNDPNKGPMTDYHEVNTIVEPPDNLEFYIKIMEIISCIHSKEPPILEINETPDLFGDIMVPGQSQMMAKQPELELTDLMSALKEGLSSMVELTFEPLIRFLNTWSQDTVKAVVENNLQMRSDLVVLKENISVGINEVQTSVRSLVTNQLYDLDSYFDDILEGFDKDQEDIKASLNSIKEDIPIQIKKIFEEDINNALKPIIELIEKEAGAIKLIGEKGTENAESLKSQKDSLENTDQQVNTIGNTVLKKIKDSQEKIQKTINEKVSALLNNTSEIKKLAKEFSSDLDAGLSILESTKQAVQEKVKKIEEKKPEEGKPEEGGGGA